MRPSLFRSIIVCAILAALALPYLGSAGTLLLGARASLAPAGADAANVPPDRVAAVGDAATSTTTPIPSLTPTVGAQGSATASATSSPVVAGSASPTSTGTAIVFPTTSVSNTVVISPAAGPPGTSVALHLAPGSLTSSIPATVTFQDPTSFNPSVTLASGLIVNSDGSFNTSVTLPTHATAGLATITVTAGTTTVSGVFTVTPVIIPNPSTAAPGGAVAVTGEGFAANNPITFSLGVTPITATTSVVSDQFGHFAATITIPATQPLGTTALSASGVTAPGGVTNASLVPLLSGTASLTPVVSNTPTFLPTAPPIRSQTPIGAHPGTTGGKAVTTAYFAEGYTGQAATNHSAGFTESLSILNPTTGAAAVTITYYIQGTTTPMVVSRTIGPRSTLRESVNADVGPDKLVAAMVTSSARVRISRTILRTDTRGARLDGSTTPPAAAPATSWGFPEGYTGITFQEYLTLLNPGSTQAVVTVRLAPQAASGAGARTLTLTVPPFGRSTANIRSLNQGNTARSVGMLVSSSVPVVAERVEYFGNGAGSGKFGSMVTMGIAAPAAQLRIAYGTSGGAATGANHLVQPVGDQDYITVLNPSLAGGPVRVTATFSDSAGHAIGSPVTVTVAAGTRQTIIANTALGTRPVAPFSVALSASGPIFAEAAQYFGGSPNIGTHPGVAFPAASSGTADALLSALSTALADGTAIKRTLYIYNPGATPLQVQVTYFGSSGATARAAYTVPANGILTANVNADTQAAITAGPVGAELIAPAGSFVAYGIGLTPDGRVALPDIGASSP